jgi:hypothetical protein
MSVVTKKRYRDDEIAIAWQGFSVGDVVVSCGERLRGSHPMVRAYPQHFVPDGTPPAEWPTGWDVVEKAAYVPKVTRKAPPTKVIEGAVICSMTFLERSSGKTVTKGTVLSADDPFVQRHPGYFAPIEVPIVG